MGVTPSEFREDVCRAVKKNYRPNLSRFHRIAERNGQMDGQTDGQNCCINIARQHADA